MMEQTDACEDHGHSIFVTAFDHSVISHTSARLSDIPDAALVSALDVV